jgi:outer membrane protein OmpA-like peptidoglycan-associated protein
MNVVFRKINTALFICLFFFCAEIFIYGNINEKLLQLINSDGEETAFTKNGDGTFIVFVRKSSDSDNSDLYYIEFKNNQWSRPSPLKEVNTSAQEITPFLSADGKTLLFASNRQESLKGSGNQPSFDIYASEKTLSGWSAPVRIFGAVNSSHDELSPFLSAGGKELFFVRRADGNKDRASAIKVKKISDSWEEPERFDFFTKENISPYMIVMSKFYDSYIFSGYKTGTQKRQIFLFPLSKRKSEILLQNDDEDYVSFCEVDKSTLVVSSDKGGAGYDFFLKNMQPDLKIKDDKTKKSINIASVQKKKAVAIDNSGYVRLAFSGDSYSGEEFRLKILYFAKKRQKLLKVEEISVTKSQDVKIKTGNEFSRIVILPLTAEVAEFAYEIVYKDFNRVHTIEIKDKEKESFELRSIFFNFNSAEILIQDIPYLHKLIDYLRANPDKNIYIEGYADSVGTVAANISISRKRAEVVRDYLCTHGINSERIQIEAKGAVSSSDSETMQNHRRVDFSFSN